MESVTKDKGIIPKDRYQWEALRMAYILAGELFDIRDIRRKTPLADRQDYALARAQCDPITKRVSLILGFCSVASLTKNKANIIDYYTNCFDWIDPVVASVLFEQAIKDEYKDKNRGNIYFDRHYTNKKYSDGDRGLPFASINFDKDSTLDEVLDYIKNHWDMIHDPNLIPPKQVQSNLEKIRETIIRALYYDYRDSSARKTKEAIEYIARHEELFSTMADNLMDKDIYTIRQHLREDLEKDWFADAFVDYENDLKANPQVYADWRRNYAKSKYRDYINESFSKVERLVRFDLGFDHDKNKFILVKV